MDHNGSNIIVIKLLLCWHRALKVLFTRGLCSPQTRPVATRVAPHKPLDQWPSHPHPYPSHHALARARDGGGGSAAKLEMPVPAAQVGHGAPLRRRTDLGSLV